MTLDRIESQADVRTLAHDRTVLRQVVVEVGMLAEVTTTRQGNTHDHAVVHVEEPIAVRLGEQDLVTLDELGHGLPAGLDVSRTTHVRVAALREEDDEREPVDCDVPLDLHGALGVANLDPGVTDGELTGDAAEVAHDSLFPLSTT